VTPTTESLAAKYLAFVTFGAPTLLYLICRVRFAAVFAAGRFCRKAVSQSPRVASSSCVAEDAPAMQSKTEQRAATICRARRELKVKERRRSATALMPFRATASVSFPMFIILPLNFITDWPAK
jgi:hypothetical protein